MRWRSLSRFLLVLGVLVLWDFAFVYWRGDGMEHLSPPERAAAHDVLSQLSATCLDNPLQQILRRHTYVVAVYEPQHCPRRFSFTPPYNVAIDVHTFLGWPMMQVVAECSGTTWCN